MTKPNSKVLIFGGKIFLKGGRGVTLAGGWVRALHLPASSLGQSPATSPKPYNALFHCNTILKMVAIQMADGFQLTHQVNSCPPYSTLFITQPSKSYGTGQFFG